MGGAAVASLAAGAIHATAVGVHGDHRQAAIAMGVTAVFQLIWGGVALVRSHRWLSWSGLAGHSAAVGGWLLAKTSGIPFVPGLQAAEGPQFADTLAAVLAAAAALGALSVLVDPAWARRLTRPLRTSTMAATAALVLVAMVSVSGHSHAHAGAHDGAGAHDHAGAEADDHAHGGDMHDGTAGHGGAGHGHEDDGDGHAEGEHAPGTDTTHDDDHHDDHDDPEAPHGGHDDPHRPPAGDDPGHDHDGDDPVPPKPYDATLPVDLGGVPGVTAEQQARAEAVVTDAIINLPHFADRATAESLGYRSIGDAFTGYEHLVNWELIGDGKILDASSPESLVYRVESDGGHTLVSAMYFLEWGETLDEVPDVGGALMQWHAHNDLCFSGEDNAWRVGPVATPPASCPEPYFRLDLPPMIHVWIVPHPCGPFAALEGVAGGQVPDGETRLCDHAHESAT